LESTPTKEELLQKILDNDPIVEMYHCGSRVDFKDLIPELNQKIKNKSLDTFKKLK